ncbi:integrase [Escherichia coli]|uniref:Integrase n=3 Tax=Enterobacteriaceae TaxID=543 RepID=A0A1L3YPL4_ECOLX|nr:integrase [Escherichia coli]EFO2216954.1 integrase [Escherichia coli O11]EFO3098093.1 integrase [Escherichia coli O153]EFO3120612.1 integrase [Escherichia coli O73]EFY0633507.1 integrase [Shigella flexneri]OYE45607.1 integrase [Shigella sonnei]OYK70895.1 integrase [Shigella boydii]PUE84920.1 integrase [Escherichia sp. R8]
MPAKKNHASGEGSHQTIPLKRADASDSAALFTGGVIQSGYRGACRTQKRNTLFVSLIL